MILYTYWSSRSFPLQLNREVIQRGPGGRTKLGWNSEHDRYACGDKRCIEVPHRTTSVRDLDETKTIFWNQIAYAAGEKDARATVSGVEFIRIWKRFLEVPMASEQLYFRIWLE